MSEHKHTFFFMPIGKITDQPNAVRGCDCGLDLLDAYHQANAEIESLKARLAAFERVACCKDTNP